jgi:hypothetical protein
MAMELLTIDMFGDKVGDAFVIDEAESPAVELSLVEATPLPNHAKAPRVPFSLLFTTPGNAVLPQRIFMLRHPALGTLSIFLVPIGRDEHKVTYQAIFN